MAFWRKPRESKREWRRRVSSTRCSVYLKKMQHHKVLSFRGRVAPRRRPFTSHSDQTPGFTRFPSWPTPRTEVAPASLVPELSRERHHRAEMVRCSWLNPPGGCLEKKAESSSLPRCGASGAAVGQTPSRGPTLVLMEDQSGSE